MQLDEMAPAWTAVRRVVELAVFILLVIGGLLAVNALATSNEPGCFSYDGPKLSTSG